MNFRSLLMPFVGSVALLGSAACRTETGLSSIDPSKLEDSIEETVSGTSLSYDGCKDLVQAFVPMESSEYSDMTPYVYVDGVYEPDVRFDVAVQDRSDAMLKRSSIMFADDVNWLKLIKCEQPMTVFLDWQVVQDETEVSDQISFHIVPGVKSNHAEQFVSEGIVSHDNVVLKSAWGFGDQNSWQNRSQENVRRLSLFSGLMSDAVILGYDHQLDFVLNRDGDVVSFEAIPGPDKSHLFHYEDDGADHSPSLDLTERSLAKLNENLFELAVKMMEADDSTFDAKSRSLEFSGRSVKVFE